MFCVINASAVDVTVVPFGPSKGGTILQAGEGSIIQGQYKQVSELGSNIGEINTQTTCCHTNKTQRVVQINNDERKNLCFLFDVTLYLLFF